MLKKKKEFISLPNSLISPTDLAKVIREIQAVDEFLRQAKIRSPGSSITPPKTSRPLEELAEANKISLLDEAQREGLKATLRIMLEHPVKVHVSFATQPSASFLRELTIWFRENVHRATLIEVGLQPSIAAGCIVRTKNQVFDLSLRHHFNMNRQVLSAALEARNE